MKLNEGQLKAIYHMHESLSFLRDAIDKDPTDDFNEAIGKLQLVGRDINELLTDLDHIKETEEINL